MRRLAAAAGLAAVLAGGHGLAWAQAGWYLIPSFGFTESFDDNIFGSASGARSDFISRFSPGFQAGYRSEPFTLLASASFDAQIYAEHSELNDALSGKHAGLTAQYLPTRPLTLSLTGAYTETHTVSTLAQSLVGLPATGVELGHRRYTLLTGSPSLAYQFNPLTSGTAGYSYTRSTVEGGIANSAQQGQLGVSRQLTPLDTATLGYQVSFFESETSPPTTQVSHALTIGWTRQLTKDTTITLRGGPRYSEGSVAPEVSASLNHQFKSATVSLGYARSQSFVTGQSGVVNTESYVGSIGFEPLRSLQVSVAPSVTRLSGGTTSDTTLYGLTAGASYQILQWLSARASYSFGFQEQRPSHIRRDIVSLQLEMSYPLRLVPGAPFFQPASR